MDIQALDQKAKAVAKDYLNLEKELLKLIIELDQSKAFYI